MPVLEVLRREELFEVTCVVTRYFGGTLLGAGGLIRAYSRGAKQGVGCGGRLHAARLEHTGDSLSIPSV